MRVLVVYYSRSGNTKKAVEELTKHVRADTYELVDHRNRKGFLGWLGAGRDAVKKKLTEIDAPTNVPSRYPVVVLATPNWAGTIPPAMRTYMMKYMEGAKEVAFLVTQGGKRQKKILAELEELSGKIPVATVQLRSKYIKKDRAKVKDVLEEFVKQLFS
ncbi:MAG: flavodoxin family protein [Candidatus Woesearchaeota archaeon]